MSAFQLRVADAAPAQPMTNDQVIIDILKPVQTIKI